uniref:Uncharacterized protein n=1 Tax=Metallosphaera hakonensis JCM 8857 = DSM 7519 TaxID=1293036 RepID=A0A2U9IRU5_9CREN
MFILPSVNLDVEATVFPAGSWGERSEVFGGIHFGSTYIEQGQMPSLSHRFLFSWAKRREYQGNLGKSL